MGEKNPQLCIRIGKMYRITIAPNQKKKFPHCWRRWRMNTEFKFKGPELLPCLCHWNTEQVTGCISQCNYLSERRAHSLRRSQPWLSSRPLGMETRAPPVWSAIYPTKHRYLLKANTSHALKLAICLSYLSINYEGNWEIEASTEWT